MCKHKLDAVCEIDGRECLLYPAKEAECESNPDADKLPEIYETILGLAQYYR